MPRLSVLMPVRDGSRWLGEAIDSVLAQNFGDFELIVIDDGSRDATSGILADYGRRDSRLIVMDQPPLGLVAALNRGLAAARGELTARLDADDRAAAGRFARQVAILDERPQTVLLGTWVSLIDAKGVASGVRRPAIDPVRLVELLARTNPFIHSSVMFRTAVAREVGGYRAPYAAAEDYDLWLRMAERGAVENLPECLTSYRLHPAAVTATQPLQQLYAARLAQRSAMLRLGATASAPAPDAPADLWSSQAGAFDAETAVFRILAWADPARVPLERRAEAPDIAALSRLRLHRKERRMAQIALLEILRAHPSLRSLRTMAWMIRLDPRRLSVMLGHVLRLVLQR